MIRFLKFLVSTKGRLNRLRYFQTGLKFIVLYFLAAFVVGMVLVFGGTDVDAVADSLTFNIFLTVFAYCGTVPLNIRRFHDTGKSGWFTLLTFIPLVGVVASLYLLFWKGTEGANEYGRDPLEMTDEEIYDVALG